MKCKPILFNTEMNRATRENRKTVTRRCVKYHDGHEKKPIPVDAKFVGVKAGKYTWETEDAIFSVKAPYQPGDILYVRETFTELPVNPDGALTGGNGVFYYKADGDLRPRGWRDSWTPSLHMPKHAARTFLKVKEVRVEHLKDIFLDPPGPENQIVREGFRYGCDFIAGWQNTCKKSELHLYGYDANPWVWVIEYEKCCMPEVFE